MSDQPKIIDVRHQHYDRMTESWQKWRFAYEGGDEFIRLYLRKFSRIEDNRDFGERKLVTPCPAFAKSAINDIKNAIFQRTADVGRRGGSPAYQTAITGAGSGVDLHGKSMNQFIGTEIIHELLVMARVGIYVDMPPIAGPTMRDQQGLTPYLYKYQAEQICSWTYRRDNPDEFQALLLQDTVDNLHADTQLPYGQWSRWRHVYLGDDKLVHVQCYNEDSEYCDLNGQVSDGPNEYIIDLPFIPFVLGELTDSLMTDVANHQVALLNLESSDIAYALKSNIPLYTEQVNQMELMPFAKGPANPTDSGEEGKAEQTKEKTIKIGVTQGRRYGANLDRPGFINPSSEPLKASMEKQQNLKNDIRLLVNLALSNVQPKMASADSKEMDERGLEAGLSSVGLVLEHMENKVARYWAAYESSEPAVVSYPKDYSLETDEDRRKSADEMVAIRDKVPSKTFHSEINKQIKNTLLGCKVTTIKLDQMDTELDNAQCITCAAADVVALVEAGIMSGKVAETVLELPEGTFEEAQKEAAARAALVVKAQGGAGGNPAARGAPDLAADPNAQAQGEKTVSQDQNATPTPGKKVRGNAK